MTRCSACKLSQLPPTRPPFTNSKKGSDLGVGDGSIFTDREVGLSSPSFPILNTHIHRNRAFESSLLHPPRSYENNSYFLTYLPGIPATNPRLLTVA